MKTLRFLALALLLSPALIQAQTESKDFIIINVYEGGRSINKITVSKNDNVIEEIPLLKTKKKNIKSHEVETYKIINRFVMDDYKLGKTLRGMVYVKTCFFSYVPVMVSTYFLEKEPTK